MRALAYVLKVCLICDLRVLHFEVFTLVYIDIVQGWTDCNVFILCVVCTFKLWLIYVWLCVLFMFWKCVCCVFSHLSDLSFKSVNWQNCFTVYTWEYIFVIYYSYPIFKLSIILLSCNRFMIWLWAIKCDLFCRNYMCMNVSK
jgi:hypothetical protein